LYAPNQVLLDTAYISLHDSSITRVDIYEKNIKKTKTNRAISTVAVIVIPLGILVALIAIACNCPQVYAYDGTQYQFKSGVFSGAIYTPLEKTDYLPLENLIADSGKFKFRVMNNQQEEQFINQLQLIKVPHDAGTNVLLDRYGIVHTFGQPQLPLITSLTNDDTRQTLKWKDGHSYMFNEKGDPASNFGSVVLSFDKPVGAKQSKLIVNAKNSLWAGYIFEEFTSLFGDKFQKYQAKQDKVKKEKIERWQKEQALSLMVYVETEKGWELADYFPTTGNTAGRDMIMTINIPDTKQDKIRIKLESAFMFWELDYIGMDFSEDKQLKPEFISASSAIKSKTSDNDTGDIISKDSRYSKLLQDEFVSVEFSKTSSIAQQDSYFLSCTGYYHSLKQYAGQPDIAKLRNFKKKGSFTEFSENAFIEDQKLLAKGINLQTPSKE